MKARFRSLLRGFLFLGGLALLVDSLGLRTIEDRETGYSRAGYTSIEVWLLYGFLDSDHGLSWVGTGELLFAMGVTTLACVSWRRARDSFTRWYQRGRFQFSLRTFLLLIALIAMVLGVETTRWHAESRSLRRNIVKLYGGETAFETVSSPDAIEVFELRPSPNGAPPIVKPGDSPIASGPVVLHKDAAARISRILRDPANHYWFINERVDFSIQVRLRMRFVQGRHEVWIDYDPTAGSLGVQKDGAYIDWSLLHNGYIDEVAELLEPR